VTYILDHQTAEGWLGPDDGFGGVGNAYWSGWNAAAALLQYGEGSDALIAKRCRRAVLDYVRASYKRMLVEPTTSWSQNRWQDWVLIIHTLMDQDPQGHEQMLWDAAELAQHQGFDWDAYYSRHDSFEKSYLPSVNRSTTNAPVHDPVTTHVPSGPAPAWTMWDHGVNNAMATKGGAVWMRQSHKSEDGQQSYKRLHLQDKFHGQPYGMFGADEVFSGRQLNRGIELCAVVEQMYSLQHMFKIQGDPELLDRCERVAYNALPGTLSEDMWAHQYLQQANGVAAARAEPHVWVTDGAESTVFGVEPNFGCCTANFNQGWPKLAMNVIFESPADGGVAVGVFAPASARFPQSASVPNGTTVRVETDYPFGDVVVVVVVSPPEAKLETSRTHFPLHVRIPAWARRSTLYINRGQGSGEEERDVRAATAVGRMNTVQCEVGRTTTVTLSLNPDVEVELGWGDSAAQKESMDDDGYTKAPGAMAAGHDVHQGNFTLIEAKRFCNTSSLCTGFTMKAPMTSIVENQEYPTFFKSARGMNADAQWSSFFKVWDDDATNAAAVVRGPLVYALHLQETTHELRTWLPFNNTDFEIRTSDAWNVALVLDPDRPSDTLRFKQSKQSTTSAPFSITEFPSVIHAQARVLPSWTEDLTFSGTASEPPPSPITCTASARADSSSEGLRANSTMCGPTNIVTLVPYGATNIRIGALPWVYG